jgi:hypothetical protein
MISAITVHCNPCRAWPTGTALAFGDILDLTATFGFPLFAGHHGRSVLQAAGSRIDGF